MMGLHIYAEPIVFFTCACTFSYLTIESEFVYQFVSESYNFTKKQSVYYCTDTVSRNISSSEQAQIVADEVSRWTKLGGVLRSVTNTISVLVVTSWSDAIGRKRALFIPVIGAFLSCGVLLINMYFRISLVLYIVSCVIYGTSGGWSVLINVGTAHLSDTIGKEQRGHRYTLLEIFSAFGGGLSQIGTGYWVHANGFMPPTIFLLGCSVVAMLFTASLKTIGPKKMPGDKAKVVVPVDTAVEEVETTKVHDQGNFLRSIWEKLREVYRIYSSNTIKCAVCDHEGVKCVHCDHSKKRMWRLWMYLVAYVFYMAAVDNFELFMTMFLVSYPLCFTPDLIGIQTGLNSSIIVFSPVAIFLLRSALQFSPQGILIWAILGRIITSVFMFFATSPVFVFIGTSFGIMGNLTTPFLRVQVSNLVSPTEQGPALALIPSIGKLVNIVTPVVILSVYTATLSIRYSFIWVLMALFFLVAFLLMCAVWIVDEVRKRGNQLNE